MKMYALPLHRYICTIFLFSIFLSTGCQVVSLKRQTLHTTIANERNSILTQNKLSGASLNLLYMSDMDMKLCMKSPDSCIVDLEKTPQVQTEQLLSAASELYLSKALTLADSNDCKINKNPKTSAKPAPQVNECLDQQLQALDKSIRYSYAYLFKTSRQPQDRIFDNRQVQIRDFYNQALNQLVNVYSEKNSSENIPHTIQIGRSKYSVDIESYQKLQGEKLEKFTSSYNMNFSGLRSINRRDGFGADFVAVLQSDEKSNQSDQKYILDPLNHHYPNGINPKIHKAHYLASTLIAEPINANAKLDEVLNGQNFKIKIYDPYKVEKIKIEGKDY